MRKKSIESEFHVQFLILWLLRLSSVEFCIIFCNVIVRLKRGWTLDSGKKTAQQLTTRIAANGMSSDCVDPDRLRLMWCSRMARRVIYHLEWTWTIRRMSRLWQSQIGEVMVTVRSLRINGFSSAENSQVLEFEAVENHKNLGIRNEESDELSVSNFNFWQNKFMRTKQVEATQSVIKLR